MSDNQAPNQSAEVETPYDWFGKDDLEKDWGVRHLVDHFYDEMQNNPAYKRIRDLHPQDMSDSRDKLYYFLSGWLGGPDLYQPKFGHPRLRARHLPFPISSEDRDQWLLCMVKALESAGLNKQQVERLMVSFFRTADWMRNQPESDSPVNGLNGIQIKGGN